MNSISNDHFSFSRRNVAAAGMVLSALVVLPAPLLPPHRLAEELQSMFSLNWKTAYLAAAVGLQIAVYCSIGIVSAFAVRRAPTLGWRLMQIVITPVVVVGV